jgi:hypothetical protein
MALMISESTASNMMIVGSNNSGVVQNSTQSSTTSGFGQSPSNVTAQPSSSQTNGTAVTPSSGLGAPSSDDNPLANTPGEQASYQNANNGNSAGQLGNNDATGNGMGTQVAEEDEPGESDAEAAREAEARDRAAWERDAAQGKKDAEDRAAQAAGTDTSQTDTGITKQQQQDLDQLLNKVEGGGQVDSDKRFSPDQQALIDLAKQAKKLGISPENAETMKDWAKEHGVDSRGPETHPGRNLDFPHIHIGPIDHIPVI